MSDKEAVIKEHCGEKALEYVKHKSKGGESNRKGNRYEDFFVVYKICELAPRVLEKGEEILFTSQETLGFVDDLVIVANDNNYDHYQLKDSANVSWGVGETSLAQNFEWQFITNDKLGYDTSLSLVVSDSELRDRLEQKKPSEITVYTNVVFFPSTESMTQIISSDKNFSEKIQYLCANKDFSIDKMECVAAVILGAWCANGQKKVSLRELLKRAKEAANPSYIRALEPVEPIPADVEDILRAVPGFSYWVEKGLFYWSYKDGLDSGNLLYTCDNASFKEFLEHIRHTKPKDFDAIEALLYE